MASALIIAFACEQKEILETEEMITADKTINLTIVDNKLQVNATPEQITQLMNIISGPAGVSLVTDDLGNTFIEKKAAKLPVQLASGEPVKLAPGEELFFIVEDMPEFPGGEAALRQYLGNNVNYPAEAQQKGVQGKVYVTFVVTKDGGIADAKIARGVDPSLDKEALRVVNALPKWKPGFQRGEAVNVSYTVPINFVLQ